MGNLTAYQQRVVDEKAELDEKITKLIGFFSNPIFPTISYSEKYRLIRQSAAMHEYSNILGERIADFKEFKIEVTAN